MSRLSVAICAAMATVSVAAVAAPDSTRLIVGFKPGAGPAAKAAVAAARGSVALEIAGMNAMAVNVPAQALAGLARNPNVEYVEEDVKRYPLALTYPSSGAQRLPYGIKLVQADQMSEGPTVRKICIIDSGIDAQHPDLQGNHLSGSPDAGTGDPMTDENHHGTHVAGTIAALKNDIGVVGVNPNGSILIHIVKVFGADGWAYSSTLANAAQKCADNGANIITMSLGGSFKSKTEENKFKTLASQNILSIAAAGNAGNKTFSYPASYSIVMSVAAVDENMNWATFSQYNSQVEIAGPGVGVLSTVPRGAGVASSLSVAGAPYEAGDMEGSAKASVSAPLFNFGLGSTTNTGAGGKTCLIARGSIDFATKVANCQASGGVAAVIYNNVAGGFSGTLGTMQATIPVVTVSQADGNTLTGMTGQSATVSVAASDYAYFDGTSMATPHVSGVAALVWSLHGNCTAAQIRSSLNLSAKDLGVKGRDTKFGYGLVQALDAHNRISQKGCGL